MKKSYFDLFLERRSLTHQDIIDISNSSYDLLKDISIIASYLHQIKSNFDKIVVIPDFDCDGIMSAVVGVSGLSELGFNVGVHVPKPERGYGFSKIDVDEILLVHPDVRAVITCDVGITAYEGVDYALEKGLTVLVTDHHKQLNADLMNAHVVVNPMRLDETYSHPQICGAFVMWQVLKYYTEHYCPEKSSLIDNLRLFAGIGTVSDMMPLRYENRQLLIDSLSFAKGLIDGYLPSGESIVYNNAFYGMSKLLNFIIDNGKLRDTENLTGELYGFTIGPMFNSLKRLNGDVGVGLSLFFDASSALFSAKKLDWYNEERKKLVKKFYQDLKQEIENNQQKYEPFIYLSDAPGGILGLLSTKLIGESRLPNIVLNRESLHGSGRSPEWYAFNTRVNNRGFYVAGHEGAFGTHVDSIDDLDDYFNFLREDVVHAYRDAEQYAIENNESLPMADTFDIYLSTCDLANADDVINTTSIFQFLYDVEPLKPFGVGWEHPMFKVTFSKNDVDMIIFGKEKNHLKFILRDDFEIIMWNSADLLHDFSTQNYFSTIGKVSINEWNGRKKIVMTSTVKPV